MQSVVELRPARRREVLSTLKGELRGKLEIIRQANEACEGMLHRLQVHLKNCNKLLQLLPPSAMRSRLEAEIADKEVMLRDVICQVVLSQREFADFDRALCCPNSNFGSGADDNGEGGPDMSMGGATIAAAHRALCSPA